TVLSVNADDTDFVKAGEPLVALDRADAQVALEQAQAALAQTVREVRSLYTANSTWGANISQRDADVARPKAELPRADDDIARRPSSPVPTMTPREGRRCETPVRLAARRWITRKQGSPRRARRSLRPRRPSGPRSNSLRPIAT